MLNLVILNVVALLKQLFTFILKCAVPFDISMQAYSLTVYLLGSLGLIKKLIDILGRSNDRYRKITQSGHSVHET
jgi:hypothetical protein